VHAPKTSGQALSTAALLALLVGALLALGLQGALSAAADAQAWREVLANRQWLGALALTLFSGLLATALALALSFALLSRLFPGDDTHWYNALPHLLAVPHAAFAIGVAFLIAPSGWLLRLVSPWLTGWQDPPALATVQDPFGVGLVLVLVLKETPFLLWAAASELRRADTAQRLSRELAVARSMGYGRSAAWWRLVALQLLPKLRWPLLAVLAYNLTVVDVSLIIGPGNPPTLAVLAWQWLQDASPETQTQGAVLAWILCAVLAVVIATGIALARTPLMRASFRAWLTKGSRGRIRASRPTFISAWWLVLGIYAAVMLALAVGSVSGVWAFPALLPQTWTFGAWQSVLASFGTVWGTALLAALCASFALLWAVAWLECAPAAWDARLRPLLYLALVLPGVLWVLGLHHWALRVGVADTWLGVGLAHSVVVLPYVLIALSPAYHGFDYRYARTATSMGHGPWRFLLHIKWPMLKAALASSWAVGFAVSVAQFLPTVYLGGGRVATVTTEAVALAAGAQRSLTAAYAWLQWLLPVLAFALATWLGRPRRFHP
jgi:putative thiamine transport system permease protein